MCAATTSLGRSALRLALVIAILALSACGGHREVADGRADSNAAAGTNSGASAPTIAPILRTRRTISDQPLKLPQKDAEMVAVSVNIPAGAALPIHKHPWSRFFYVERGTLRVVNHDTGASMDFKAGQVQAEAVGQWHEGRAVGPDPVHVIVIDLVPAGVNNTIMKPAAGRKKT